MNGSGQQPAPERGELWSRIGAASFLTDDEKRAAVGYGPAPGGAGTRQKLMPVAPSPLRDGGAGSETATPAVYSLGAEGQPHWMTQPRVPAGSSEGGQWTDEGGVVPGGTPKITLIGGSEDSQAGGFSVDLLEHEWIDGGDAITYHVAKSDTFLINLARLRQLKWQEEYYRNRKLPSDGVRVGSFSSLTSANKLVSSTLSENAETVRRVASGILPQAVVRKRFDSVTGKEAYAPSLWGGVSIRETRAVGVLVIHSPTSRTGFRIHTAFPIR